MPSVRFGSVQSKFKRMSAWDLLDECWIHIIRRGSRTYPLDTSNWGESSLSTRTFKRRYLRKVATYLHNIGLLPPLSVRPRVDDDSKYQLPQCLAWYQAGRRYFWFAQSVFISGKLLYCPLFIKLFRYRWQSRTKRSMTLQQIGVRLFRVKGFFCRVALL